MTLRPSEIPSATSLIGRGPTVISASAAAVTAPHSHGVAEAGPGASPPRRARPRGPGPSSPSALVPGLFNHLADASPQAPAPTDGKGPPAEPVVPGRRVRPRALIPDRPAPRPSACPACRSFAESLTQPAALSMKIFIFF